MNLIIDQGNTVCKVAVAVGKELHKHCTYPQLSLRDVHQILAVYPDIDAAVYSSVAQVDQPLLGMLSERMPLVIEIGASTPVPLEIRYDRARLGSDRLAGVVGAYSRVGRLPLLSDLEDLTLGFGQTTREAISRGVLQGIVYEIDGYIQALRAAHPDAVVYLTGGDATLIQETLRQEVCVDPDLVLYGLNEILEYNK